MSLGLTGANLHAAALGHARVWITSVLQGADSCEGRFVNGLAAFMSRTYSAVLERHVDTVNHVIEHVL